MKHGFTIIELMIATALSSMIGMLLMSALYQGGRSQRVIDSLFDTSLRVGIVSAVFERDVMGAFVPNQARIKDDKEEDNGEHGKNAARKQKDDVKKTDIKETDSAQKQVTSKPAEKPLEKIFYATRKNDNLDVLTFITNNPIDIFVAKDTGKAKPKIVRVQYRLQVEDEKERKDSFSLMRQESAELDLSKFGTTRAYEVIGGIKKCVVTYTARIPKKDAQQGALQQSSSNTPSQAKQTPVEKKITYDYKNMHEWVSEQPQENKQEQETMPRVPCCVDMILTLWNKQYTKDEEFILSFELPVDTTLENKKEDKKESETRKPDEKKSSSSTPKQAESNKKVAGNDVNHLVNSLSATLGNVTKALRTL